MPAACPMRWSTKGYHGNSLDNAASSATWL